MKKILLILSSTIFLNSCWGEPYCVLSDSNSEYCMRVAERKYPSPIYDKETNTTIYPKGK